MEPRAPNPVADQADYLAAIVAVQTELATASLALDEVMALTAARAQELTGATGAAVELTEGEEMVYRAATGSAASSLGLRLPIDASLSGRCVRTGTILQCDDSEIDPRVDREACRRVGARSMLVVPLRHEGRIIGVLKVLSMEAAAFGTRDLHTLQLLASLIAAAMARAAAFEALERETAERRRRQLFLETLLENLADAVVACDAQGRVTLFNRATRELRGLPHETVPPEQWSDYYDLYFPDGETRLSAEQTPILRALREGRVRGEELVVVPKGQPPRTVVASGQALVDENGRKLGAVVAMHDVTARKAAEEQLRAVAVELQRKNRELERALAEVRQLQGILPICGYCKSIRDDGDYWHQVENYITHRSEARFSHSVCPECVEKVVKPQLTELRAHRLEEPSRVPTGEALSISPTVLIVEDQREMRETFAEVLEEQGFRVATAPDGAAALAYLRTAPPPSVILLDLLMPVMTGWEFRTAQQEDPALAAIPVVAMSGLSPVEQKADTLGVAACLTKPVEVEALLKTIAKYCVAESSCRSER